MTNRKLHFLWHDVQFLRLWSATIISSFGDAAYFILLGWFVIRQTGSPLALGTVLTIASIPRLIFMLIGGVLADRVNRKWILVTSLAIRSIVLLCFSLILFSTHHVHSLIIDVLAAIFGTVDAFFWPASGSIVPRVVTRESLPLANSLIQTSQQLSAVMGPLIASALLLLQHYTYMFLVVALLYLSSSLLLVFLGLTENEPCNAESEIIPKATTSPLQDLKSGISYALSIPILTMIMFAALVINVLFMGPINIGIPVLVRSNDWSGSVYATFEASFGLGAIAGGILIGVLKGMRGHMKWLSPIGSFMGIGLVFIGFTHIPWQGMLLMAAMGITISVVNIPIIIYIQTIVAQDKLGRVMSLLNFMSIGLTPVGYAGFSFLIQSKWLVLTQSLVLAGVIMSIFWLILGLIPSFRNLEDHPLWKQAA